MWMQGCIIDSICFVNSVFIVSGFTFKLAVSTVGKVWLCSAGLGLNAFHTVLLSTHAHYGLSLNFPIMCCIAWQLTKPSKAWMRLRFIWGGIKARIHKLLFSNFIGSRFVV